MRFQTYKEWTALGRQVVKGQKAFFWDGVPVFAEEQTKSLDRDYGPVGSEGCDSDFDADNDFLSFGDVADLGFGWR